MYAWECMIGTEYAALQEGRTFCVVETGLGQSSTMCEELEVLQCHTCFQPEARVHNTFLAIPMEILRESNVRLSCVVSWDYYATKEQQDVCGKKIISQGHPSFARRAFDRGPGPPDPFNPDSAAALQTGIKKNRGCGPYAGSVNKRPQIFGRAVKG
ncbi:hypothetical protein BKA62DRAFT_670216 [Auriculariales sp. MPI-PUGE-AT-0066]|nr:hypothetical protein BKA62DRAFT_670216 [Auriculariales sp. MPI-PUGE-AT-0066]